VNVNTKKILHIYLYICSEVHGLTDSNPPLNIFAFLLERSGIQTCLSVTVVCISQTTHVTKLKRPDVLWNVLGLVSQSHKFPVYTSLTVLKMSRVNTKI